MQKIEMEGKVILTGTTVNVHGSVHFNNILIYIQQDATFFFFNRLYNPWWVLAC